MCSERESQAEAVLLQRSCRVASVVLLVKAVTKSHPQFSVEECGCDTVRVCEMEDRGSSPWTV